MEQAAQGGALQSEINAAKPHCLRHRLPSGHDECRPEPELSAVREVNSGLLTPTHLHPAAFDEHADGAAGFGRHRTHIQALPT